MAETAPSSEVDVVISALEEAVIGAAMALRAAPFGMALGRWNPRMRCALIEERISKDCTPLADTEVKLGMGPPIRSAFAAIEFAELVEGRDVAATDPEYMEWVERAHWALQRIAGKCWAPIPQRVRLSVVDVDDFSALTSAFIPRSRENDLGPALAFEGLDSPEVTKALQRVFQAIRVSPVHQAACEVLAMKEADKHLMHRLERARSIVLQLIRERRPAMSELQRDARTILEETYGATDSSLLDVVRRFWSLNELINNVMWVFLGYADAHADTPILGDNLGSIRVTQRKGRMEAHFTLWQEIASGFILGTLPVPFEVRAGIPLDGLYLSTAHTLQFSGLGLMDVVGNRLADLERSPQMAM